MQYLCTDLKGHDMPVKLGCSLHACCRVCLSYPKQQVMSFGFPPLQASNSFIRNRLSKIHTWHPLCPSCALQLWLPSSFLLPTDPIPPSILPYPPSQSHQLHSPLFTLGFLLPPFDICPSTGPFHHHLHSCFLDPHSCAMSSHISLSFPLSGASALSDRS